jgi:hypothetical protein
MAIPDRTRRPHRNLRVEAFHGLQSRRNGLDTLLGRPVSTGLAMSTVTLGQPTHRHIAKIRPYCPPARTPWPGRSRIGEWRSLVARLLWEQRVAGSNPVSPTTLSLKPWEISLLVWADGFFDHTTTTHPTSTYARHKAIPHVQDPPYHPCPRPIHFSAPRRFPRYYLLARSGPPFALPIPRQRRCRVSARQRPLSHINRTDRIGSLLSLCVVPPNGRRSELRGREKLSGGLN